jgi:putative membrane protein
MVKLLNNGLISDAEQARIADAIARAEAQTSGEIYCVVARKSGDYAWTTIIYGIVLALLAPVIALLAGINPLTLADGVTRVTNGGWSIGLGGSPADEAALGMLIVIFVQVLILLIVAAIGLNRDVREALTPAPIKRQNVHRVALEQFLAHGIHLTRHRTGVLIFVSLSEHQAEVIADEGIYAKVDPNVWREAVGAVLSGARANDLSGGIIASVEKAGTVLAQHFPSQDDDTNEIPNRVVII